MAKPNRSGKTTRRFRFSLWRTLLIIVVIVGLAGIAGATAFATYAYESLPAINLSDMGSALAQTSFIYDMNGDLAAKISGNQNRVPVTIDQVPMQVQNAFISIEDQRFRSHFGVDPIGIARAALADVTGHHLQGASTIDQELIRNYFDQIGTQRKGIGGIKRKIQEAIEAIRLERVYTKPEILDMYLNTIFLGEGSFGVEAASETYFGKHVGQLDLAEAALIAGLPQAPSVYDPYRNLKAAKARQKQVLQAMVKQGYITQKQADDAYKEPLNLHAMSVHTNNYAHAHFIDMVISRAIQHLSNQFQQQGISASMADKRAQQLVYSGGLKIYSTMDPQFQSAAEQAVNNVLDPVFPYKKGAQNLQAGGVFLDQKTGAIRAIIGGRKPQGGRTINYAYQAYRQPGSSFKPIVAYLPAITEGMTPATVIDDSPAVYQTPAGPWSPINYDHTYRGLTTLREGLRRSVNVMAVKLLNKVGVSTGIEYAKKLGITTLTPHDAGLALALGGLYKGVSPMEMAEAYATFADGGVRTTPYAVTKIVGPNGNILYQANPPKKVVLPEDVAYIMTSMLESVVQDQPKGGYIANWGTGARANDSKVLAQWQVAGKTGTTSSATDNWFVGYTPKYTGAVWIGYPQGLIKIKSPVNGKVGEGGLWPAEIWQQVMTAALKNVKPEQFKVPNDIVKATIDIKTGQLVSPSTPDSWKRQEVFIKGTEPTQSQKIIKNEQVIKLKQSILDQHPDAVQNHPELRWNHYVLADGHCAPYQDMVQSAGMLDRPPVDWNTLLEAAKLAFGKGHSDAYYNQKAASFAPTDASWAIPQLKCSDLPSIFTGASGSGGNGTGSGSNGGGGSNQGSSSTGPKYGKQATYSIQENDNGFQPVTVFVAKNQKVTLQVTNTSNSDQDFAIPALKVDQTVPAGQSIQVQLVPDQATQYAILNSKNFKVGRIVVVDDPKYLNPPPANNSGTNTGSGTSTGSGSSNGTNSGG